MEIKNMTKKTVIPPELVHKLEWKEGVELAGEIRRGKLTLAPPKEEDPKGRSAD
jgi:hypothetical protein